VVAIRPESREVVIGGADELGRDCVRLEELNWLAEALPAGSRCEVQLRYRSPAIPATIAALDAGSMELRLDRRARAVAPGQSGVLYAPEGRVLGGGVIS
jgi:tRNA-specific 2-thiouridylase